MPIDFQLDEGESITKPSPESKRNNWLFYQPNAPKFDRKGPVGRKGNRFSLSKILGPESYRLLLNLPEWRHRRRAGQYPVPKFVCLFFGYD